MTAKVIAAKAGTSDDAPSASVEYDFGDDLAGAAELFGDDVVFSRFVSAATVDLQALIRRHLSSEDKEGNSTAKSEEDIQALVAEWKPGVSTRVRVSASEKAQRAVDNLSDDEKAALLESLMADS